MRKSWSWSWIDDAKNTRAPVESSVWHVGDGRLYFQDGLKDVDGKAIAEDKTTQSVDDLRANGPVMWMPEPLLRELLESLAIEPTDAILRGNEARRFDEGRS
jgi:hypothetical protein